MTRTLACVVLGFLFLAACPISEEEKIHQTLRRRKEAFQKKDLSLYLSCISPSYQDKDEDFNRIKRRMEGYFKTFDRIAYNSGDVSVEISGNNTAEVVMDFEMEVERGGKEDRYSGKEFLFLRKEGATWRIIGGL